MQKYESKQQRILRPAETIFNRISRFDTLTPALQDKVEAWHADADSCSFKIKGFSAALRIVERTPHKTIKIQPDSENGIPVDFTMWIQLHPVSDTETRLRIVLHADLNMMMRMMIGGKLQEGVDRMAEGIAKALA